MRFRLALLLVPVAALALAESALPREPSSLPDDVPDFVAAAAERSVGDFAYALAEARFPAGVVAFESDSRPPVATSYRSSGDDAVVPLEVALGLFRSRHPTYEVEEQDGVLVVRERELDLGQGPLARGAERIRIQVLPLRAAFNQAMRIVDPSIQVRDGFVGSIIGRPAEPSPLGLFRTQVTLDMSNATLPTVLNEIVKQARGTRSGE